MSVSMIESASDTAERRLLKTAHRLFCSEGIHATGIARILEESGVARKTLYDKFGSKENLVSAVLEAEGNDWRSWFSAELAAMRVSPHDKLLAIFDLLQRWFDQPQFYGCAFINAVSEHKKNHPAVLAAARRHRELTNDIIRPIAAAAGVTDPDDLVETIATLMDGTIVTAMITGSSKAARQGKHVVAKLLSAENVPAGHVTTARKSA